MRPIMDYTDLLTFTFYYCSFLLGLIWLSSLVCLVFGAKSGKHERGIARGFLFKRGILGFTASAESIQFCKPVVRRAVVIVGGDFARSPRMQYHATSLARCGLFDEITLVGFDAGNRLSEALQYAGGETCVVNTKYLVTPFQLPLWMLCLFSCNRWILWISGAIYRLYAYVVLFSLLIARACVMWVNKDGQLFLTDIIFVQAPPSVPVVPMIKYIVQPGVFIANAILYYGFIVPASWCNYDALQEIREGVKLQQQFSQEEIYRDHREKVSEETHQTVCNPRSVMWPPLVVDWHNFGHTILRSDGRPTLAVWVYWFFERYLCWGDRNITVSKAMRAELISQHIDSKRRKKTMELEKKASIKDDVVVLYDTAPTFFRPIRREEFVRDVLSPMTRSRTPHDLEAGDKAGEERIGLAPPPSWIFEESFRSDDEREALEGQRESDNGDGTPRARGVFMVAATSWTMDDDYTAVVKALVGLDKRLQLQQQRGDLSQVRPLWLLVTGKGETREYFERAVKAASLSPLVTVTTLYFQSYKEYAMALGAADVGLCVHYSSSGLDLPMKAVDMLGSGLPVVAWRYAALPEILDEKCAWLFSNAEELEDILWTHVLSVNPDEDILKEKKRHVLQRRKTWDDNWNLSVLPLVQELVKEKNRMAQENMRKKD